MPDLSQFGLGDPTGTVSSTGAFTPDPSASSSGELNPFVDAGPWGRIDIGDVPVPGVIKSVDGAEKPEEWSVQKGTSSNFATTVWKGTKLAEDIKIVTQMTTAAHIAGYYRLRDTLRPKLGEKPPALLIVNPTINFNKITRISHKNISPPKWQEAGGFWNGEITIIEFNPEQPAKAGTPKGGADPNADVKKELDTVLKAAAAA